MKPKKLAIMATLTTIALIIFMIEAQIPLPIPIPGAKLGLANTVTLLALFYKSNNQPNTTTLKTTDALMILTARIILGAVFTGRPIALIYSITGGLLAFAAQALMKRIVTEKQIWACGAIGAIFHNIGQIAAAMIITGTPAIIAYLPVLTAIAIATGTITGLAAQLTITRLKLGNE